MDLQLTIKVVIVGEKNSGRAYFKRMLYPALSINSNNFIAETYFETDPKLFPKVTRCLTDRCQYLNSIHKNKITYRCINKCLGITDSRTKSHYINKNVFLSFCHIGDNYEEHADLIATANIIIYLTPHKLETPLFCFINDIVACHKKCLLTLITKQDINPNFHCQDMHISCMFAHSIRCMIYKYSQNIDKNCCLIMANCYGINKNELCENIYCDKQRYLLQCGFAGFRDCLVKLVQDNYREMIYDNFLYEMHLCKIDFMENIEILLGKVAIVETITEKICGEDVNILIQEYVATIADGDYGQLNNLECLRKFIPETNCCIKTKIETIKNKIISTCTDGISIDEQIYLPSAVCAIMMTMNMTMINCTYVCELYSSRTIEMLKVNDNLRMVSDAFFCPKESENMLNILICVQRIMPCELFKTFMMKILIAKLAVAVMIIESCCASKNDMMSYCKSLGKYLSCNINKKCYNLFTMIIDICDNIAIKYFDVYAELMNVFDNLECRDMSVCNVMEIDRFIIQLVSNQTCNPKC
uniref:Uncharacterized protein n=1 Tax=viral metagenome TaxID=1070528 RepID=A0A6C0C9K0_9ZZZZ